MTSIEWKPEFSVGEPILDADHRQLIQLLNRFSDPVGPAGSKATIIDHLVQLYRIASKHFAREEAIMQTYGFNSEYVRHYADHQRLLNEITFMMYEQRYGLKKDTRAITEWVHDWFHEHHTTYDARLRMWIHKEDGMQ